MPTTLTTARKAENKISFDATQAADVRRCLHLGRADEVEDVFFLEDLTVGAELPLLRAGVILRLRRAEDGPVRTTVKLRPARWSQLTNSWIRSDGLKLEHDHGQERAVLAASLDGSVRRDTLKLVRQEELPRVSLFAPDQLELLADCSPIRINIEQLDVLGPVTARRWTDVTVPGFDTDTVTVEQWEAEGLEFFEVSLKTGDIGGASAVQDDLTHALRGLGLTHMPSGRTKTEQMLEHLARARPGR